MKKNGLWVLTGLLLLLTACVSSPSINLLDDKVDHYGNLALYKAAISNGDEKGYPSDLALDGNPKTRWSSTFIDDALWVVDLGYITRIDAVQIFWETPPTTQYELQISNDTVNWETFAKINNSWGDRELLEGFEVQGRYVRFFGVKRPHEWGYSFWEFEVYGEIDPNKESIVKANKKRNMAALESMMAKLYPVPTFDNPPPFRAVKTDQTPIIDGEIDELWSQAVTYPLGFNQLSQRDMSVSNENDISGTWKILYSGTMLYGLLSRTDDVTFIDDEVIYANDCVETFVLADGVMEQRRSLIGQPFDIKARPMSSAWNQDGSILEFSMDLGRELDSTIINWNIALADNDGDGREAQLYPLYGNNHAWEGKELGELVFGAVQDKQTELQSPWIPVNPAAAEIIVDADASEWNNSRFFPLIFNQLNTDNLVNPDPDDISAKMALQYIDGKLFGIVYRTDDRTFTDADETTPWEKDNLELFLKSDEFFVQLRTIVGQNNFDKGFMDYSTKAVWNSDNSILEFMVELSDTTLGGKSFGFNAAISDNDGDGRDIQLYPVTGKNISWEGQDLTQIQFQK